MNTEKIERVLRKFASDYWVTDTTGTRNLALIVSLNDQNRKIESFIRSALTTSYTEGFTAGVEKAIEIAKETELAIRKTDKTPKYEYSHNSCDANRDGEFPDSGQRWAMPWELASSLVARLAALTQLTSTNEVK